MEEFQARGGRNQVDGYEGTQESQGRGRVQGQAGAYGSQAGVPGQGQASGQDGTYTAMEDGTGPEKAWFMEDPGQNPMGGPGRAEGMGTSPEDSSEVTEEELEALLKEFLAT